MPARATTRQSRTANLRRTIQRRASSTKDMVEGYVKKNPITAALIAAGVGAAIGIGVGMAIRPRPRKWSRYFGF
jgi:ElaB/YqjD/DUF883 family membrane-anchored ribosome-binding protein